MSKGIIEQIKENDNYESTNLNLSHIKAFFEKTFNIEPNKDYSSNVKSLPYIKEIYPGLWEIFTGTSTLWTGDGGKEEFENALKLNQKDEL